MRIYDAVRAAGADNLVVIGGLDWAYDLTGVPTYRISGYNILYATHPYAGSTQHEPSSLGQRLRVPRGDRSGRDDRVR